MYYFLAAIALIVLIILLNFYIKYKNRLENEKKQKLKAKNRQVAAKAKGLLVNCPLCNSILLPGEDLFTKVYRPMTVHDQLCTIDGCPHCFPIPEPAVKRECPVCHKEVPIKTGHLIARLFNKTQGKKHVIVTGCTECSKGAK